MNELMRKIGTISGLEKALKNASWGIESMTLECTDRGEFIRVDFKDDCYPTYYINITGSSPQGIIKDVMRFIDEKKYKGGFIK